MPEDTPHLSASPPLVDLLVPADRATALTRAANRLPGWILDEVQRGDLDLLVTGGYTPLTGFLAEVDAASVRATGGLADGTPWPVPVTLAVDADTAAAAGSAERLALRDAEGTLMAVLTVTSRTPEAGRVHLGGPVEGVRTSARHDFADLRPSVADLRAELARTAGGGWGAAAPSVLVAQPAGAVDGRTAMRWRRAAEALDATLLLYPAVGADPERVHVHRVRGYAHLLAHLPDGALLRLLASGRDPTDPDAAALHAVVARNAGATHLLLGEGAPDPATIERLGLVPVDPGDHAAPDDPPAGRFHGAVAAELVAADPPRRQRGLVVFLTGLSGSGKSTIAKVLRARLIEAGDRQVTLLDGDLVRRHLSSELGFSREDRDRNIRRIGFVASEIARHGGIAVCAPIAPYDATRRSVRRMAEDAGGGFVLVHVATPLEVCEERDTKGLYAQARAGALPGFTGVDDPYEVPEDAEVTVDASTHTPEQAAATILAHLVSEGWYAPEG